MHFRSTAIRPILGIVLAVSVSTVGVQAVSHGANKPHNNLSTQTTVPTELPAASNSEGKLQPNTVHLLRLIEASWPYYANGGVIGGYRQDAIADHPSGQALDIMMNNGGRDAASVAQGHQIAAFLTANASQLGIEYLVWRQSIWHPGRDWRLMEDRGDWTSNHMDHIHAKVYGDFQATDDLVMPGDLQVSPDQLPDGEALRVQHEIRVAAQQKVDAAQARLDAAQQVRKKLGKKNRKRADVLLDAQRKVTGAVRQSYMLGMDPALLAQSAILFNADRGDAAVVMGVTRQLRTDQADVNAAVALLDQTATDLMVADDELNAASEQLKDAQGLLALANG